MLGNVRGFSGFGGSLRHLVVALGSTLFAAGACGDSDKPPPSPGDGVQRGGSGALGGSGGAGRGGTGGTAATAGTMGGEGGESMLAPNVTVTSPQALDHPDDGPVLVDAEVIVTCEVTKSSEPGAAEVNGGSVRIEMLGADGTTIGEPQTADPSGGDEYSTTFFLQDMENGEVSFRCTASDIADMPNTGSDTISTLVDFGPTITIRTPELDSIWPQVGEVHFQFEVEPAPVVSGDTEAEVDSVTLTVQGVEITTLDEEAPGLYGADVDFTDPAVFNNALEGELQLRVDATNRRSDPGPVTRTRSHPFIVDGEGPMITVVSPANQSIVGGRVRLQFDVVDELAGVRQESVTVTVNSEVHRFRADPESWAPVAGDSFEFTFESGEVLESETQATIRIDAMDNAMNPASTATMIVFFDNVPPIVDLDPWNIRELKGTTDVYCSFSYDPLGTSPNDLSIVHEAIPFLRTFVWDETNEVYGATPRVRLPDRNSVYVYLQADVSQPIIMDSTGTGGVCDSINPALTVGNEPRIQLAAVPPAGAAWFGLETADTSNDPPMPSMATCGYEGVENPPPFLCNDQVSDIRRALSFSLVRDEPVIYGVGDLAQPVCTGDYWEIQQFTNMRPEPEGWICLASIASDKNGNTAVSRPLRLCYDDTRTSEQPSCMNLANPPSCLGDCTLPRNFAATGTRIIVTGR